jgi:hypothetical protein
MVAGVGGEANDADLTHALASERIDMGVGFRDEQWSAHPNLASALPSA